MQSLRPLPAALLARPTPRQVLAKVKSKAQALPKRGVRLYDLRENHCRWVLDRDGHEPAFCGAPQVGSSSWCAAHRKIVYPRAALQEGAARKRQGGSPGRLASKRHCSGLRSQRSQLSNVAIVPLP